jgi:hypothetical protein
MSDLKTSRRVRAVQTMLGTTALCVLSLALLTCTAGFLVTTPSAISVITRPNPS